MAQSTRPGGPRCPKKRRDLLGADKLGGRETPPLPASLAPASSEAPPGGAGSPSQLGGGVASLTGQSCSLGEGQPSPRVWATPNPTPISLSFHCPSELDVPVRTSGVKGSPAVARGGGGSGWAVYVAEKRVMCEKYENTGGLGHGARLSGAQMSFLNS